MIFSCVFRVEVEKTKLIELRESLEHSNRELLADVKSLESQKTELEGKVLRVLHTFNILFFNTFLQFFNISYFINKSFNIFIF